MMRIILSNDAVAESINWGYLLRFGKDEINLTEGQFIKFIKTLEDLIHSPDRELLIVWENSFKIDGDICEMGLWLKRNLDSISLCFHQIKTFSIKKNGVNKNEASNTMVTMDIPRAKSVVDQFDDWYSEQLRQIESDEEFLLNALGY